MKSFQLIIVALILTIVTASCYRGHHVIISTQSNDVSIKIEYAGYIALNDEKDKIESISHDGYINYNNNGNQLYIASDRQGHIDYELNGNKTNALDSNGKRLLTEAIKIIVKHQVNN